MSDYGIQFADWCEFPPEMMVGETVFDGEGNAIGWITNATVGRETLTAEQVRECAKGVYFEGYGDGATHKVNGIEKTDWQTIADKLNATLGAGTCNIEKTHGKSPIDGKEIVTYKCSECGTLIGADSRYCNQCGARVVSE